MAPAFALARLTAADLLRQPATWLVLVIAIGLIVLSAAFGMFSFAEEDRMRMLCSSGIAVNALAGLFLGVVGATVAVHRELADRTALTLLAKPIGRGAFLIGKALGILSGVAAICLVIALVHVTAVHLGGRSGFEYGAAAFHASHEHNLNEVSVLWQPLVAGHLLAFAQAACLTCLAIVLALRMGLAGNIITCFAAWIICHLLPQIGLHGAVILPALDILAADDAAQVDGGLPWSAVGIGLLHAGLWCSGALSLGLALFERQDIP